MAPPSPQACTAHPAAHSINIAFSIKLTLRKSWDNLYETEISNHAADPSDLGTIWFDDSAAEDKLLAFLHSPSLALDISHTSFLDIGTGNGHFLVRLREPYNEDDGDGDDGDDGEERLGEGTRRSGFMGRMLGTDYSQKSIELARRIAAARDVRPGIEFLRHDIMASPATAILTPPNGAGYDVVLDKGTFDAISLSEERLPASSGGRRLCEGYKERVLPLVREGGVFLVTSCNWTEAELRGWFEGGEFVFETGLKYRSFRFGGREGQSISSVCLRKRGKGG